MKEKEARRQFAYVINSTDCPECPAKKGKVCEDQKVWVHHTRIDAAYAR